MLDQSRSATIRLTVVNPTDENDPYHSPEEFLLSDDEVQDIYIGRAPGNTLELSNAAVSGQHIRITQQGDDFILHDLGSRNGTSLNDERLTPKEQKLLRDGDRIRVVNYVITFHHGVSAYQPQSTENTTQIALDMIKSVLGGIDEEETPPKLFVMSGPIQGHIVELKDVYRELTVGRSPECDLVINDENISRKHAQIRRDWTGVTVRDLNSRNGIVVNGVRIERNVDVKLNDRDEVVLGLSKISFSDPEGAQLESKLGEDVGAGILGGASDTGAAKKTSAPPPSMPHPSMEELPATEEAVGEASASEEDEVPSIVVPDMVGAEGGIEDGTAEGEEGAATEGEEGVVAVEEEESGLTGGQMALIGITIFIVVVLVILGAMLIFGGGE